MTCKYLFNDIICINATRKIIRDGVPYYPLCQVRGSKEKEKACPYNGRDGK